MISVCFVVHCFEHARAALAASRRENVRAVLISAPQLVPCAGVRATIEMMRLAEKQTDCDAYAVVLDCGRHVGAALAALRLKNVCVFANVNAQTRSRLSEIAAKTDACVLEAVPAGGMDLKNHFHLESACRDFIQSVKGKG